MPETTETLFSCKLLSSSCGYILASTWILETVTEWDIFCHQSLPSLESCSSSTSLNFQFILRMVINTQWLLRLLEFWDLFALTGGKIKHLTSLSIMSLWWSIMMLSSSLKDVLTNVISSQWWEQERELELQLGHLLPLWASSSYTLWQAHRTTPKQVSCSFTPFTVIIQSSASTPPAPGLGYIW